jgi:hypothetical protein
MIHENIKLLNQNKMIQILPFEEDVKKYQKQLEHISIPIITVNGRNVHIEYTKARNCLFEVEIKKLLEMGAFVLNTTHHKPNLDIQHPNYLEFNDSITYSETLAIAMLSNCMMNQGNAGGINIHLNTPVNLCILNNCESWVESFDTQAYKFNGKSLVDAIKKHRSNLITTPKDFRALRIEEQIPTLKRCMEMEKLDLNRFKFPNNGLLDTNEENNDKTVTSSKGNVF